jgi:hypothetical protein
MMTPRQVDRSLSEMAHHHEYIRVVNQTLFLSSDEHILYRDPRTWLWVWGLSLRELER